MPDRTKIVRRRVIVSGQVQGVFFRASTTRMAFAEGVSGWVRNLPDGDVEAVFQGPEANVERCVTWCGTGPPGARVMGTDVIELPVEPSETGFTVRH